jgi:hypothetical protein
MLECHTKLLNSLLVKTSMHFSLEFVVVCVKEFIRPLVFVVYIHR